MAVLLQTRLEIVGVELQMGGITGSHGLQVLHVFYAVYHVAAKPEENGKGQGKHNPNGRPRTGFLDRHHVCLAVDDEHV